MAASRSRTLEWRRSLQQIRDRSGAIEIAVARPTARTDEPMAHLGGGTIVWRVRVVDVTEQEIVVEEPSALGRPIQIAPGIELVAAIAIGQNRWVFRTVVLGTAAVGGGPRPTQAVRIHMPANVERSSRRGLRVDTAALQLPEVEVWPLLDPKSVVIAERYNEVAFEAALEGETLPERTENESLMPTVGPKFTASLMNLGGGGVGLKVDSKSAAQFSHHRVFWMRLSLKPELPVPICASGKVVHTHIDSAQCTYAGLQFDFTFNPSHERFVAEQIRRYIMLQQDLQRQAREQYEGGEPGRAAA